MNHKISQALTYAGIFLLFVILAYGFTPWVFEGKIVNQSDISSWKGMANEAVTHNAEHPDDPTAWTNSMFGGMPTTAFIDDFQGDWTQTLYKFLLTGRRPASYLLITLIGGFLLMMAAGVSKAVAVAGAIAIAFCSYNMQIIQVGHNTKMQAIAFFPWVLAAVIYTYKTALSTSEDTKNGKKYVPRTLLCSVLFATALSLQIKANHIQITYYLAIVIAVYVLGVFVYLCTRKDRLALLKRFAVASALLLVTGLTGIATNANKLIPTYEYTPFTMRGGSELSSDSKTHNKNGLDLGYATAWSYGIEEMPNLIIPNFNGGSSSGALDKDSQTGRLLKRAGQPNLRETLKQMPLYWGPQPFTAGPMYLGAISVFLFIMGLMLCSGKEKWWILAATLIAVFLAWGSHFIWFTKLWFDYAPLYNKFRTVSMALTVLQVTVPLLGFVVLDQILKEKYDRRKFMKAGLVSYAATAGFCLLCFLAPGIAGTFTGAADAGQPEILVEALKADRMELLKSDAIRSFALISIVFALLVWATRTNRKDKTASVALAVAIIVFLDLASVGKRYLNKDHFVTVKDFSSAYQPRPVDETIHGDTDPDFRVLDISVNTFNNAITSYHHKTIGGYSPVKMQRYQDLIDRYLSKEIRQVYDVVDKAETIGDVEDNLPALKMTSALNGKYIILDADLPPVLNRHALGHCWFIENTVAAETPDEEIALLASTDLRTTAVVGEDFKWARKDFADSTDSSVISLTQYAPNDLRYSFRTSGEKAAVFSEIFYPKGWKAWIEPEGKSGEVIDGHYRPTAEAVPVDIFRADWILRGVILPEGSGELIMRFEPESYRIGENISRASSILLILLLMASIVMTADWKRR